MPESDNTMAMAKIRDFFHANQDTPEEVFKGYRAVAKAELKALANFNNMTSHQKECWIHQRLCVLIRMYHLPRFLSEVNSL